MPHQYDRTVPSGPCSCNSVGHRIMGAGIGIMRL
jgi:hypothetical protein